MNSELFRQMLVLNVKLGTSPEAERQLEQAFLSLPGKISCVSHYSLGRNIHPMRPEFWMCTHIWEAEFNSVGDLESYENDPSYRQFLREYLDIESPSAVIDRVALISYRVDGRSSSGNLLHPGRLRRLHIANLYEGADKALRKASDDALLRMPREIPEIKAWALGYNISAPREGFMVFEHSWDVTFNDIRSLQAYVTCDYHLGKVHDYAVKTSPLYVLENLQSCYYLVDPEMSG